MNIPDAAIEAAARRLAFGTPEHEALGVGDWWDDLPPKTQSRHRDHAHVAIEAAMPAIREALAQEIEADESDDWTDAPRRHAARIVRGES